MSSLKSCYTHTPNMNSCLFMTNFDIINSVATFIRTVLERLLNILLEVNDMANITKDQMLKTADLARIAISEEEAEMYSSQINEVLAYVNKITELNTDDVKPTTHGIISGNVLRKDEPKRLITQEEALKNAPDTEDGQFKVPAILE